MRTVLYTHDLIPITVIDLPAGAMECIHERGSLVLQAVPPLQFRECRDEPPMRLNLPTVRITAEPLWRGKAKAWMLFTSDEESALALKAAFLPGQQREVRDRERTAFVQGVLHAISMDR